MDSGFFVKTNVLMSLDVLINIDLGILYTIRDLYPDSKYINYSIFDNNENRIIYYILNRVDDNVLSLIIKDKYKNSIDDLLIELYDKHYEYILEKSTFTNIISMLYAINNMQLINIILYCKNKLEEQFIKERLLYLEGKTKTIIENKITDLEFNIYDTIFVNKLSDIKDIIDTLELKPIYIFKSKYNLIMTREGIIIPKYIEDAEIINTINLVEPYNMDETFFIDGKI